MAINYTRAAKIAKRLLVANGRLVTFVDINNLPDDVDLPWGGSGAQADTLVSATAVFVDPVSEKDLGREVRRGPGDNVISQNQICFFSALENPGVDFTEFDRILDHGLVWTIDELHVLQPGPTVIMYEARVRI